MHAALLRRMELEAELRRAIAAGQFILHYQPIVVAEGGAVVGAEALVRWEHPERGMIPPGAVHPHRRAGRADRAAGRLDPARGRPPGRRVAPARASAAASSGSP